MEIAVIGAGYVGLTIAPCLAEVGHSVICADNNLQIVDTLQTSRMPIFELHLTKIIGQNRAQGRLEFASRTDVAVGRGETVFICGGTPRWIMGRQTFR